MKTPWNKVCKHARHNACVFYTAESPAIALTYLFLYFPLLAPELPHSVHPIHVQAFRSIRCLISCPPTSQSYSRHISIWHHVSIHLHKLLRRGCLVASKTSIYRIQITMGNFSCPQGKSLKWRQNAHLVFNNTHCLPAWMSSWRKDTVSKTWSSS